MEYSSEIDAMVGLATTHFSQPPITSPVAGYEMALRRFHKEFPTPESQQAFVDSYRRWKPSKEFECSNESEQIRTAFRFWFQVIWPNLPRLRTHRDFLLFQELTPHPAFGLGSLVVHQIYEYRGVIAAVDRKYHGTDNWYATVARSNPPKNRPWYRVLVDEGEHVTYVAERHLMQDSCRDPVVHPLLKRFFSKFENGRYLQ